MLSMQIELTTITLDWNKIYSHVQSCKTLLAADLDK